MKLGLNAELSHWKSLDMDHAEEAVFQYDSTSLALAKIRACPFTKSQEELVLEFGFRILTSGAVVNRVSSSVVCCNGVDWQLLDYDLGGVGESLHQFFYRLEDGYYVVVECLASGMVSSTVIDAVRALCSAIVVPKPQHSVALAGTPFVIPSCNRIVWADAESLTLIGESTFASVKVPEKKIMDLHRTLKETEGELDYYCNLCEREEAKYQIVQYRLSNAFTRCTYVLKTWKNTQLLLYLYEGYLQFSLSDIISLLERKE